METVAEKCGLLEVRLESSDDRRFTISVPVESMRALVDAQNYRWNEVLTHADKYMEALLNHLHLPENVPVTDTRSPQNYERTGRESFMDFIRLPRNAAITRVPSTQDKIMQIKIDATALGDDAPRLVTEAFQSAHGKAQDIGPIRELDRFGTLSQQRVAGRGW